MTESDLIKTILESSDKIGIGVLALVFALTVVYAVRLFFRYMNSTSKKDEKVLELGQRAIEMGGAVGDVIDKLNDLVTRIQKYQENLSSLHIASQESLTKIFSDLIDRLGSRDIETAELFTNKVRSVTNEQTAVLNLRFDDTINRSSIGVLVAKTDGAVVAVNSDFCNWVEYPSSWFYGKTIQDVAVALRFTNFKGDRLSGSHFISLLGSNMDFRYREIVGLCTKSCETVLWFSTTVYPIVISDDNGASLKTDMFYIYFRKVGTFESFS